MHYLRRDLQPVQLRINVERHSCIRWADARHCKQLQQRYPDLELTFASQLDFTPQQALLQGELDMGINRRSVAGEWDLL